MDLGLHGRVALVVPGDITDPARNGTALGVDDDGAVVGLL